MRTLRNKVSLIIWMSGILLVAMVVGLVAPNFMGGGKDLGTAAAVVDGQPVDAQQFSNTLTSRLERARQTQGGDLSEAESNRIRRETLNSLIDETIALDHAKGLGQTMNPDEFRQELMSDPGLQDGQGHFDQNRYERILEMQAEQGIPWQQAEQNFQRAMLLSKVRGFWAAQAVLTPLEESAAEARFNRQVQAKIAVWNVDQLRSQIKIDDDDLHTYYSENKQKWEKPDQVKLREIVVRAGFASATGTAKLKADQLLAKIKAGADFKTLAATENADDTARKSSGDLGWVARTDLRHEALADAAFKLQKGQVSPVIDTADGFTILKVEDRRPGFEPTFANSKDKAAHDLGTQRALAQASLLANQALAAMQAGTSIEDAAKAGHGSVVSTAWFDRDAVKVLPALDSNPNFAKQMLGLNVGASLGSPITSDKAVVIAQLSDERPGSAPKKPGDALARVAAARQDALSTKAQNLYDAWIAGLRKKANIIDQSGVLASK